MKRTINIVKKILFPFIFILPLIFISASSESSVSPDEALTILQNGNKKFTDNKRGFTHLETTRLKETADKGQHPIATILSCSDSRVPPEHIFDAGIGDIFIIRVAGNVADIDEIGTIEYGVEHLHTPLLVVMGHTSCGAVTAVLKGDKVEGFIPKLVDNIIPAVEKTKKIYKNLVNNESVTYAAKENVWQSISDTITKSEIVRDLVKENKLKVVGALYHIEDGKIEWLGAHPDQTKLLSEHATPVTEKKNAVSSSNIYFVFLTSLALIILFFIIFYIFVSPKNKSNKFTIKQRITASFIAVIILTSSSILINYLFVPEMNFFLITSGIVLPVLIALISSVIYINTIVKILKNYLNSIKAKQQV
jgi:carbonic anhydrase